jgi:proline dehydrogenase
MSYKNSIPLYQREYESTRILAKYPNIIPVIVESRNKDLTLKKNKSMKIENKNVLLYSSINTQNERAISQKYTCQ